MKKFLLYIFLLASFTFSYSQNTLRRQAFWGASFIPNSDGSAGVTIRRIEPGSPAEIAGFRDGDLILNINNILLSDPYVFGKIFRSIRAEDKVRFSVLRNGQLLELSATPLARPMEHYKNIDVEYGSVITSKGHHVRTILTKPSGVKGKLPVIFITQWLSCSQVEVNQKRMSDTDSLLNDLITKSGYAVMRVEKPGLGDSEGPDCSEADYESELAAYRAAYKALKKLDFIDTNSVFVLGISIGSASAPLVFAEENIKGYIVTGGFYKTWFEHMLEIERNRLQLTGKTQGEITDMIKKYSDFYNEYLNYKLTPAEVIKKKPYLEGIWYDGNAHQYGRPAAYYQQVQDKNVAAAWEKINSPTLVIYGEYDWIMSRVDHELIAQAVNKNHKGNGTLLIIPRMSHNLTIHPSLQDAFNDANGVYGKVVSEEILKWLKMRE